MDDEIVLQHEPRAEKRGHMPAGTTRGVQEVRVVDLDIKFWSMVMLFVKAAIAAIPAAIIVAVIWTVITTAFVGLMAGAR